MDNSGIVQLVIATIFYSTLVAPNIKKMSDIKADISDMKFPLKTSDDYEIVSKELGTSINKKMKQYDATYSETRKLLWLLYLAMGIALISQLIPIVYAWLQQEDIKLNNLASSGITLAIFLLLVVAMKLFLTKPERIRTFEWLASVGIAFTYTRDIFNPTLELNSMSRNLRESNNHVHIKLASNVGLYGYSVILTIEDISGQKLYHVVAGRIQKSKYIGGGSSYYPDGRSRAMTDLVYSLSLKPGKYKTRFLLFDTAFPGVASPTQVLAGFEVTAANAKSSIVDVDLSTESIAYTYKTVNDRPYEVEFTNDLSDAEGIKTLLSSDRFQNRFSKTKILFSFGSSNGVLTYDTIEQTLHPLKAMSATIMLKFRQRKMKRIRQRSIHLNLK